MNGRAGKRAWIWVLCFSIIPTMLVYANYATALPIIKAEWGLTNAEAGLIYSTFYVGYVVSSTVLSTATDYASARVIFLASALWLGLTNLLFPLLADGFWSAAMLRALTGVGLAGVYSPGLRMVIDNTPENRRSRAVSVYAFCYTLGVATSTYATGFLVARVGWPLAFGLTSAGPLLGLALVAVIVPPSAAARTGGTNHFEWPRLSALTWAIIGTYVLHRWELFAFRGWIVTFLAAALMSVGMGRTLAVDQAASAVAALLTLSAFSNLIGGWLSDRIGATRTIGLSLSVSGSLAIATGLLFGASYPLLLAVTLFWVVVLAMDAPVFLTLVARHAPPRHMGSALGLVSGLGFLLGSPAPAVVGLVLDLTNPGLSEGALPVRWGWAFAVAGGGALLGACGTAGIARLMRRGGREGGTNP